MATREVTTETQPVEKDFIGKETISLEIREDIRKALQIHLDMLESAGSRHHDNYTVISYTDNMNADKDDNNRLGRIMLANDESKRVIPDPFLNNEHLIYNKQPPHVYTVWVCTKTDGSDKRFLYGWSNECKVYVIAPYCILPVEENSGVLCSHSLQVTNAVYGKQPIKALEKDLEKLSNRSNTKKGFNDDMYHWDAGGFDDNFSVLKKFIAAGSMYWKVGGTGPKGDMLLTPLIAEMAHLTFVET